ncbi:thioester dehydrase [Neptunicella sp. SCSIO 80796]|uniref:ApeI family dehydratase n=1 Tax=Neptunicella plasticusilytica TaxID=3117012 RepID=UPI003A4D4F00
MNSVAPILQIRHEAEKCLVDLRLEPELACFDGHFPGMPVLPGVVQLDWAVKLAKTHLSIEPQAVAKQFEVLKFQQLLVPGLIVTLELQKKDSHKVLFSYHSERGQHASGRIVFEDKV